MASVTTKLKWDGDVVKIRGQKVRNKSIFEIGLVVEGNAKQLAPVDTGRLAGSITTQSKDESSGGGADTISRPATDGVVLVGTAVEYAPYMEFGTSKTDAQAFLRPALRLASGQELTIVKKNSKYYFGDYLS